MIYLILSSVILSIAAVGQRQESELATDSIRASSTEIQYDFRCLSGSTRLRLVERIARGGPLPLADRWRINVLAFDVAGRQLEPGGLEEVQQALHEFSWLTLVQGRCDRAGNVNIFISGMPAEAWANFAISGGSRPSTTSHTIQVDPAGEVTVR